jgi:hypothetical protein
MPKLHTQRLVWWIAGVLLTIAPRGDGAAPIGLPANTGSQGYPDVYAAPPYSGESLLVTEHANDEAEHILILVHGQHSQDLSTENSDWDDARREPQVKERWGNFLRASRPRLDGRFEIWRYVYDNRGNSLGQCATDLNELIDTRLDDRHLVILAHSYGGLVAREFMTKEHGHRVRRLITLATPHLGTPGADLLLQSHANGNDDLWKLLGGAKLGPAVAAWMLLRAWQNSEVNPLIDLLELTEFRTDGDRSWQHLRWHPGTVIDDDVLSRTVAYAGTTTPHISLSNIGVLLAAWPEEGSPIKATGQSEGLEVFAHIIAAEGDEFISNDGMVPMLSATLGHMHAQAHDVLVFDHYDHREMVEGKTDGSGDADDFLFRHVADALIDVADDPPPPPPPASADLGVALTSPRPTNLPGVGASIHIDDGETETLTFTVGNSSDHDVFGMLAIHVGTNLFLKGSSSDSNSMELRRVRPGDWVPKRGGTTMQATEFGLLALQTFGAEEEHTVSIEVESLDPGTHRIDYRFTVDDVNVPAQSEYIDAQGYPVERVIVASTSEPKLTWHHIDPYSGTTVDNPTFHFCVTYKHDEGIPPHQGVLYIDGVAHQIDLSSTNEYGDYCFDITAAEVGQGAHTHYFEFTDTRGGVARLPRTGAVPATFAGPEINPPKADINVREPDGRLDAVRAGDPYEIVYAAGPSDVVVDLYLTTGLRDEDIATKRDIAIGHVNRDQHGHYQSNGDLIPDGRYTLQTDAVPPGTYYIYAVARDARGNQWTDFSPGQLLIYEDTGLPPLAWSSPEVLSLGWQGLWDFDTGLDETLVAVNGLSESWWSHDNGATWIYMGRYSDLESTRATVNMDSVGRAHVVAHADVGGSQREVLHRLLTADGQAPVVETNISRSATDSEEPYSTIDGRDVLHTIWTEYVSSGPPELRYSRSTDSGGTWNPPSTLAVTESQSWLKMAAYDTYIYAVYHSRDEDALYLLIGANGGANWAAPVRIDRQDGTGASKQPLLASVAANQYGIHVVHVVDASVIYQRSSSLDRWQVDQHHLLAGRDSTWPTVAAYDSTVYVTFDDIGGHRIAVTYSEDGGVNWSHPPHTVLDGTEKRRPQVAVGPDGYVHVLAEPDGDYMTTAPHSAVPTQPQIAFTNPSGPVTVSTPDPFAAAWAVGGGNGEVTVDLYRDDDTDPSNKVDLASDIVDGRFDVPIGGWPNGTYYLYAVATDANGATDAQYSSTITVALDRPVDVLVREPDTDLASTTSATVLWSLTSLTTEGQLEVELFYDIDTDSSEKTSIEVLTGEEATNGVYEWTLTDIVDGDYYIVAVARSSGVESAPSHSTGRVVVNHLLFAEPDGVDDVADETYTIAWNHRPSDAQVDLYYDSDTTPDGVREIALGLSASGEVVWDTSSVDPGEYYIYGTATGRVGDATYRHADYSTYTVSVDRPEFTILSLVEDSDGVTLGPGGTLHVTATTTGAVSDVRSATFSVGNMYAMPLVAAPEAVEGVTTWAGTVTVSDGNLAKGVPVRVAFVTRGDVLADETDTAVRIDAAAQAFGIDVDPTGEVTPGTEIRVRITAEEGADATFSIEGVISSAPMTIDTDPEASVEEGFAALIGTYEVQRPDAAKDASITVVVTDSLDNQVTSVASDTITIRQETSFTVALNPGVNLLHVPVKVDGLDSASDLYGTLGGASDVGLVVMLNDTGTFVAFTSGVDPDSPADVALADGSGAIVVMKKSKAVTFTGGLLATDVSLSQGINVVGVPRDGAVATAGGIADLSADVQRVIREENGRFVAVVSPATDADVTGGAAYIVLASADATLSLDGGAWENSAAAAPITNVAYNTNASPVFLVQGSLVREDTLDVVNGIEVTVTNMRTGDSLTDTVGRSSGSGRFATTFLSLDGTEYKVGDTFDLRVVDPSGTFGGVRETQRIITREDMRNGRIDLGAILVSTVPERSGLLPNFPNPFNPETWIPFDLSEDAEVTVTIYDALGLVVRRLELGIQDAGVYRATNRAAYWNGRNEQGEPAASGAYFVELSAGDVRETRRIVLLK